MGDMWCCDVPLFIDRVQLYHVHVSMKLEKATLNLGMAHI